MEGIKPLVEACLEKGDASGVPAIAEAVRASSGLLALVEQLGPTLSSVEAANRAGATNLLSSILPALGHEGVTEAEADYLLSFYCDRLKDHTSATPVLRGLSALAGLGHLQGAGAVRVVSAFFKELHVRACRRR